MSNNPLVAAVCVGKVLEWFLIVFNFCLKFIVDWALLLLVLVRYIKLYSLPTFFKYTPGTNLVGTI